MEFSHRNFISQFLNFNGKTIHQLSTSYLVGRLLTIFFKRRFSFQIHTRKDVLHVLPVFLAFSVEDFEYGPHLSVLALVCSNALHCGDEMGKTVVIWLSIYIGLYAEFSESTFACLGLGFATTQFLRKPNWLKIVLREPRVLCGPVYAIFVCSGLRFCTAQDYLKTSLTMAASIFSVIAALIFRPDNNATLRLVLPEARVPSTRTRQVIHGVLLFGSFLATLAKFPLLHSSSLVFKAGIGFGMLNIVLFVNYKFFS